MMCENVRFVLAVKLLHPKVKAGLARMVKWYKEGMPGYRTFSKYTRQWDGEGLPPVGCTVQLVDISSPVSPPFDEWLLGDYLEVIAHKEVYGTVRPVVWNDRKQTGSSILPRLISPVSQETLAAEKERQQGIQEMVSLVSSMDLARALEVLYDAGYRKQEDTE